MSNYKDENSQHTLRDIIRDPSRKVGEAQNELSFLFRMILLEHRIGVEQWENLTTRYFTARYESDRKVIVQEKINLSRAIAKERLTWQRFMEAIETLGYDECEISITLKNLGDDKNVRTHKALVKNKYKQRTRKG